MKSTTVGIDLAKNAIQAHAVDEDGKVALSKKFKRDKITACFVNVPACLIEMEASAGAHYWARRLHAMGRQGRLVAPQC